MVDLYPYFRIKQKNLRLYISLFPTLEEKRTFIVLRALKIITPVLGKSTLVLGMKVKQGESTFGFKDKPINNHVNEKISSRAVH